MATTNATLSVDAIPLRSQRLWGPPAGVNFALGGLGTGLYLAAALAAAFGAPGTLRIAAWLGPALVVGGFLAVATEAGHPWRGVLALRSLHTSWMSRELWLGGAFVLLAAAGLVAPGRGVRLAAALAAAGLALAQGAILRGARAVPAWAVPVLPWLFLASALASGAALLAALAAIGGRVPPRLLGGTLVLLTLHLVVWWVYLTWSREEGFVRGVQPLRDGRGACLIVGGGYLGPALAFALAVALPALAVPLTLLGAAGVVASHVYMKAALVLRAGWLRPVVFAVPRSPRRSR